MQTMQKINVLIYVLIFLSVLAAGVYNEWLIVAFQSIALLIWILLNKNNVQAMKNVQVAAIAAVIFTFGIWIAMHYFSVFSFPTATTALQIPIWLVITWIFALQFVFSLRVIMP